MRNDYIRTGKRTAKRVSVPKFSAGFSLFFDESVLPFSTARRTENFEYSSGALRTGYGLKRAEEILDNANRVWHFSRYDFELLRQVEYLMFSTKNGEVYYVKDGGSRVRLEGISLTGKVLAINYRLYQEDVILMFADEGMFVWDGRGLPYRIEGAPDITSLAIHYERLFVTEGGERNVVRFSDDLDPTNFNEELDEGGYIQMLDERGKLNKVISFINYVYVFRDYGITRLVAFADQTEFSTSNLFVSAGKIYADTVAVCGDTVMFLAGDGIYRFDGVGTQRIVPQLSGAIDYSPLATAVYHDGKYFLSARLIKDGDSQGSQNNALIVYDIKLGTVSILSDVSIDYLASIDGKCYAVDSGGRTGVVSLCGEVFGAATTKVWESGFSDFDTPEKKAVREVSVDCDSPFDLTVYSENSSKTVRVLPKDGLSIVKLNVVGRKIGFRIVCKEKTARIARLSVRMER